MVPKEGFAAIFRERGFYLQATSSSLFQQSLSWHGFPDYIRRLLYLPNLITVLAIRGSLIIPARASGLLLISSAREGRAAGRILVKPDPSEPLQPA